MTPRKAWVTCYNGSQSSEATSLVSGSSEVSWVAPLMSARPLHVVSSLRGELTARSSSHEIEEVLSLFNDG